MDKKLTDSRFGVYEGIIALAWADHELTADEQQELHRLIDGNLFMSDAQRQQLRADVDDKVTLAEVWPRVTDKQDRAFLLNLADVIFHADGKYCKDEQSLYDKFFATHMETIDQEAVMREISALAFQQQADRERLQQEMAAYEDHWSMINRIKRAFEKI